MWNEKRDMTERVSVRLLCDVGDYRFVDCFGTFMFAALAAPCSPTSPFLYRPH